MSAVHLCVGNSDRDFLFRCLLHHEMPTRVFGLAHFEGLLVTAYFFFFQAEDGIRDIGVTGVQTCALPISCPGGRPAVWRSEDGGDSWQRLARGLPKKESFFTVLRDALDVDELKSPALYFGTTTGQLWIRSEERRVGKEARSRWWAGEENKK